MKNLLVIILAFTTILECYSQRSVSLQLAIDGKMLSVGDQARGFKSGTIDLSTRFIMQGHQKSLGYMIVYPEFVYRNTAGSLKMYSLNAGYVWNVLIIPKSEIGLTAGWGFIDHYGKTNFSFVFTQSYALKLNKALKAVIISDIRERSDLQRLYPNANNTWFKWNLRVGLELKLN